MARPICLVLFVPLACSTATPPQPAVNPSQAPPVATSPPPVQTTPPPETTPPPAAQTTPPQAAETTPPAVTSPPPVAPTQPGKSTWTDAGGGLSVRLELPTRPPRIGDRVQLRLHFRNTGPTTLRIYMIDAEVFRAQQSDLAIFAADGSFIASQPEPHPHGHVVDEGDFPAIVPGKTAVHIQTLNLKDPQFAGVTGPLRVTWTYTNKIEAWKGGEQTFDGPTKSLFGGGPIPGIWRGEVSVDADLPLAPAR